MSKISAVKTFANATFAQFAILVPDDENGTTRIYLLSSKAKEFVKATVDEAIEIHNKLFRLGVKYNKVFGPTKIDQETGDEKQQTVLGIAGQHYIYEDAYENIASMKLTSANQKKNAN